MKRRQAAYTVILVAIVSATAIFISSRTEVGVARAALTVASGSELWMEGKSTVHDWESRTKTIKVSFTPATGLDDPTKSVRALILAKAVHGAEIQIPVASLHSEKKGIDKNMLKALHADKYPTIVFRMDRYTVVSAAATDTLKLRLDGALTVTGVEKPITLDAIAWKGDKGEWIEGVEPLNISDFGIKPPAMMLGTLRVKDRIVIHYRLLLAHGTAVAGVQKSTKP